MLCFMTVQKELSGVRVGQGDQPAKWTLVHVSSARRCGITFTCCHGTGLLSVTFMIRHQFQIHCSLSLVLIHLTMSNLLLSIHGFSTNDCRGSGPQRTCLSSSTLSRRLSFASIWGLHSYPSCGTPEVSILTFKRKPSV